MEFHESEFVELKEIVVEDVKKEIIAFANCDGGKLYIGIRDDGQIIGVEDADAVALQISNMVRDAIKPDLTMFLHYETLKENGEEVVCVNVQRGTERPYYIAKKGMRPEGVYVRQGYSSVPATDTAIRRMIKETDGDHFEDMRSLNQDLTFEAAKREFSSRQMEFGVQQMRTLKLMDKEGIYSNLALLLSDQCVHTIKVAVFQGTDQNVFKDRREFTGSILQQMNEVYDYIDIHNQTHATIEKLLRVEIRDYPEIAVREALLNLIVHREYSFHASGLISIFDNRLEFVSVGGLVPGVELEDVMVGISVCRNEELADVFYRLHLIEAYGTGLTKIMNAYKNTDKKPVIETTRNTFKIILPNINTGYEKKENEEIEIEEIRILNGTERRVLEYAKRYQAITKKDVANLLGVSESTALRKIKKLVKDKLLTQCGKARSTYYTLTK